MAVFVIGPLLGPVVGPIIGGFLAEAEGWRWVFWVFFFRWEWSMPFKSSS